MLGLGVPAEGVASSSGNGETDGEQQEVTIHERVFLDAQRSPRWKKYVLDKQVYQMMVTKDRSMPMAAAARSPRHIQEHKVTIIPPARPKPIVAKKKKAGNGGMISLSDKNQPWTPWRLVQDIAAAINGAWNTFLEQDLEVQIVLIFLSISACISIYKQVVQTLAARAYVSHYEHGRAPPLPPLPPIAPDWTVTVSGMAMRYALKHPVIYLLIDFGIAIIIGAIVLFWEDIKAWRERQALRAAARMKRLRGEKTFGTRLREAGRTASIVKAIRAFAFSDMAKTVKSPRSKAKSMIDPEDAFTPLLETEDDLKMSILRENDLVEELEIKLKVHASVGSPSTSGLATRLALHKERQIHIKEALKGFIGNAVDNKAAPVVAPPPPSEDGWMTAIVNTGIITVLKNSANGFISVFMFFADMLSDIAVIVLLWTTGNYVWAVMAITGLVAQFVVMYQRCLPYMRNTFGAESCINLGFVYLGFPFGLLILDFLMLLEPFGLLTVLPLPTWLKQFIPACELAWRHSYLPRPHAHLTAATLPRTAATLPRRPAESLAHLCSLAWLGNADKATRVITEIAIESLPQSLLQSYILIVVVQQTQDGTANDHVLAMVDSASVMPQSISISTLAILKTWIEIVQQSREAGISVRTKASQLWHVGAGLPLDALKKGSIVDWACTYVLDKAEIPPLLDALIKNTSLARLNLAEAGLEWDAGDGSAGPLVEALAKEPTALSGLQKLVIHKGSGFEIPISELRAGPKRALAALEGLSFYKAGHNAGMWHTDIMVCGDVLRANLNWRRVTDSERAMVEEVMRLLEDAHNGDVTRAMWEQRTKLLMASGDLRRSLLQSLVGAECLRDVGFSASELINVGFSLIELKAGRFTVTELRDSGVEVADLSKARYSAAELREGDVTAAQLKPLGYEAEVMREGGYTAAEVKAAKYALADLKGVYTAVELYEADYSAGEMRKVGYEVGELKGAQWPADVLRKGGYSATEMRAGGFDASQTRLAGYNATEATSAGWTLIELKNANYDATDLRQAKHSAAAMREAGFMAGALRAAKYPTQEQFKAGFNVEELRKAGTPISEIMAAGATIAEMRASGISAGGLKIEGVKLKDLRLGGFTCKEAKGAGYSCNQVKAAGFVKGLKDGGYSINEAVAAKFGCEELFLGGYAAEELLSVGFKPLDMRAAGYDANALQAAGVTLPKLRAAGVPAGDLRSAGFTCDELRNVGVKAEELHASGTPAAELKQAGYPLPEFSKLYSVGELRACEFSCEELRGVGFSAKQVLSTGATNRDLREGGYTAGELRKVGVTAKELKALQYTCSELKECGFNAKELAAVGFGSHQLKVAGFRARHVKESGFKGASVFGLAELKADGFRVLELKDDEGFTLEQLSSCFSVEELRKDGGITAQEMLTCGYSLKQMRQGGFNASQLYEAGYGVLDMKKAGFTCLEVRQAGFIEGIKAAGYTCKVGA